MRLADRIPPDDERLAALVAKTEEVAPRRAEARDPGSGSSRVYRAWLKRYKAWAVRDGVQSEIQFLTDRHAEDFVRFLVRERLAPNSIESALSALRDQALRLELKVMPTFVPARAVLDAWVQELAERQQIFSAKDTRIRPARSE